MEDGTPNFAVQTMRIAIFEMNADSCFLGDWDHNRLLPRAGENSSPYHFLHSYASLRDNFVHRMHSTIVSL